MESNAYRTRTYLDLIFSDGLCPNDLAVIVWLAGMWLHQEHAALSVNWEKCLSWLSEEDKAESLDTLTTKGWIEFKADGSLTLHIPKKLYYRRYGKPDPEIIKRMLVRGGPKPSNLRVHAVAYFYPWDGLENDDHEHTTCIFREQNPAWKGRRKPHHKWLVLNGEGQSAKNDAGFDTRKFRLKVGNIVI